MKVTLEKVFISPETITTKFGDTKKVGLKIIETEVDTDKGKRTVGERWISGFLNKTIQGWKKGDIVEIDIVANQSGDKEYLNFKVAKKDLEERVAKLEDAVFGGRKNDGVDEPPKSDEKEINADEIDF